MQIKNSLNRFLSWSLTSSSLRVLSQYLSLSSRYSGLSVKGDPIKYLLFSQVFASRTFKRVGASVKMSHLYKVSYFRMKCLLIRKLNYIHFQLVLIFSAFLQMSAFFTIASSGLWIDTICTSTIARFASHRVAYKAIFIITCIVRVLSYWRSLDATDIHGRSLSFPGLLSYVLLLVMHPTLLTRPFL